MIENLKQIIEQSQRTQRNWDLNKSVKDAAKSMSTKDIKDFANTDRKGLPNKVSKKEFINKFTELLDAEMLFKLYEMETANLISKIK